MIKIAQETRYAERRPKWGRWAEPMKQNQKAFNKKKLERTLILE
jgi:hypothetical protein